MVKQDKTNVNTDLEHYLKSGRQFGDGEKFYLLGFEAALHARNRCKEFDQIASEMAADLEELQRQGKVRWIGVSNFTVQQLRRAQYVASVTSLQPRYSLVHREVEDQVLPYCSRENIGVIVYSPMASGLLTGAMTRERAAKLSKDDWRRTHPDFTEPNLSRNLALVEHLHQIARRHNRSAGEVAIAWTLHNAAVTGAIVGARNEQQAEGVMRAGELRLTDQDVSEIDSFVGETAA